MRRRQLLPRQPRRGPSQGGHAMWQRGWGVCWPRQEEAGRGRGGRRRSGTAPPCGAAGQRRGRAHPSPGEQLRQPIHRQRQGRRSCAELAAGGMGGEGEGGRCGIIPR